ncbi:MAG: glutathione S-transferase family protein [Hydrogenophaga sp.]|nr:glutathione S-transferase family protein [Hydrogenophaga sp.]
MKLHWSPKSPYVRKVMASAMVLGLDGRIERMRSVAAMLKPNQQLMQDNPLSKIPTLVLADGTVLFDSAVICEYLDELAGGGLLFPRESTARWQALRWQAFGDGLLDALILWRNERERAAPLPALMDAFAVKVAASLRQLDQEAGALTRAPLSIGSLAIGCALGYMDYRFAGLAWRQDAPALAVWHDEVLCNCQAFAVTAPVED